MKNRVFSLRGGVLIAAIAFLTAAGAPSARAQLAEGLVNYWNFDNNLLDQAALIPGSASSVADDGAFAGANGVAGIGFGTGLFGGAGTEQDGNTNSNNGFVEIPRSDDTLFGANATNPAAPSTLTTSMWINAAGFDTNWQTMISHGEGSQYRIARRGGDIPEVAAYAGGSGDIPNPASGPAITADTGWHHIVAISEGGVSTRLWVDNTLVATGDAPLIDDARGGGTLNLSIGANPDTGANNREWWGEIDDVAQWNRVLADTEIAEIFNAGGIGQSLGDLINFVGDDSDDDGMTDAYEIANDLDPDDDGTGDVNNGPDGDPDMDGLVNIDEFNAKTRANKADTDEDGYNDKIETGDGSFDDIATDTGTDPLDPDTDDDGLEDGVETNTGNFVDAEDTGTNPLIEDSDDDGRNDGYEVANGQAPNDNSDGTSDPDNDNSNNEEEFARGTDPNDADTDDDMLTDGAEDGTGTYVDADHTGTNPLLADSDGDGLSDGVENPSLPYLNASQPGTDPNKPDSDMDGFTDGVEIAAGKDPTDPGSRPSLPISLGVGTGALLGMDLTDPENDGDPEADANYNAVFMSSEEPGFAGGEFAYNVFDNTLGPGNDKWCCGNNAFPLWVQATFEQPIVLTDFTVSSANDTPGRDPRVWEIQGSNDGINFDTIFRQDDPDVALWTQRLEVLQFTAGTNFTQPPPYSTIRFTCFSTGLTSGAKYQVGEIELFGLTDVRPFQISEITYDPDTDMISITWPSREGTTYALYFDTDLEGFESDLDDGIEATPGADFTTYTFENPIPGAARLLFRVAEN